MDTEDDTVWPESYEKRAREIAREEFNWAFPAMVMIMIWQAINLVLLVVLLVL